ncbi:hypothetical protein BpHYR1_043597 [Brachionus plicatilis]|uniref:Uncharacterized protein n=1 Tax=Brachionus plicatilis TaxID=10195 RepID=A0A3M7T8E8_BRAPC|nr:hypothetical protein BpHYR1_043597 [Brachionus plicatilis]
MYGDHIKLCSCKRRAEVDERSIVHCLDEVESVEGVAQVVVLDAGLNAELSQRKGEGAAFDKLLFEMVHFFEHNRVPVGLVAEAAEVGERFFGRARLSLDPTEQVAEVDEKAAVAVALILRHDHDAAHVVLLHTVLFFAKVADQVTAVLVVLGKDVEQKWLDVVVKRFVVEKQLGQETQILSVDFVRVAVHFEHAELAVAGAINFVAGRTQRRPVGRAGRGPVKIASRQYSRVQLSLNFERAKTNWSSRASSSWLACCTRLNSSRSWSEQPDGPAAASSMALLLLASATRVLDFLRPRFFPSVSTLTSSVTCSSWSCVSLSSSACICCSSSPLGLPLFLSRVSLTFSRRFLCPLFVRRSSLLRLDGELSHTAAVAGADGDVDEFKAAR